MKWLWVFALLQMHLLGLCGNGIFLSDPYPFNPNPAFIAPSSGVQASIRAKSLYAGTGLIDLESTCAYSTGKHQVGFQFNYSGSSVFNQSEYLFEYGLGLNSGSSLGLGIGMHRLPGAENRKLLPAIRLGVLIQLAGDWQIAAFGKQMIPFRDEETGAALLPLDFRLAVHKVLRGHSALYFQIDFSDQYPLNYHIGYRYMLTETWAIGVGLSTANKSFGCLILGHLAAFDLAFHLQFQAELGWSPEIMGAWMQ